MLILFWEFCYLLKGSSLLVISFEMRYTPGAIARNCPILYITT